MSFLSIVTSLGAQLSITILQLLFLSIETTAGMPDNIGFLGAKMVAMKLTFGSGLPLYLAVITVEARAGKTCSFMATI